ncbi:MAG TPA: hypothetical protein VGF13_18855 [Verrucomicrobiae bacterium]|jgi:hypothetical protein
MKARWVLRYPSRELPFVGQAVVASWWPGKYYFVSTWRLDSSSPLHRLTQSLKQGVPFTDADVGQERYMTQILKCTKDGISESFDDPLYEREYSDLSEAKAGHNESVDLLEQGRLKLGKVE